MAAVAETLDTVQSLTESGYKWGFETDIEMDVAPKGLNEDTIRMISARKDEPAWLLAWRLKAYAAWLKMESPDWAKIGYPAIDYQDIHILRGAEEEGRGLSLWTTSILSCSAPMRSSASRSASRLSWLVSWAPMAKVRPRAPRKAGRSRSMPCSTACPWRPRFARACTKPA